MRQKIKILTLFVAIIFAFLVFSNRKQKAQTQQTVTAGEKFKNIKVLNEMPADQMGKVMNLMSASLGVNCNFCHISNEKDFEKDDNEHKQIAREMIKMTLGLNKNNFDNRPEISCNTCHNGHTHPNSVPNLNADELEKKPNQPATKPTVEQILDKYAQALGGKANLEKITSRKIKATRLEPDGKTSEPEEILQKSGKSLVSTKYRDYLVFEGFDGKIAWKSANEKEIKLKPDEAEQIKREAELFVNPNLVKIYSKMDYRSADEIGGRQVYVISATTADNQRERLYFDAQTGFLARRTAAVPTVLGFFVYQVDYSDYKDFGSAKLPTTLRYAVPNITWTRKILEVVNNVPIDDAKFDLR